MSSSSSLSSSSSSSIASPAVDISDDSAKRTTVLDKDRLEQLEKEQAKSSLSDLTLKEAAETRWLSGVTLLCSTSSRETMTGSPVCRTLLRRRNNQKFSRRQFTTLQRAPKQ